MPTYVVTGVLQIYVPENNWWLERTERMRVRAESPDHAREKVLEFYRVIQQVQVRWHTPELVRAEREIV